MLAKCDALSARHGPRHDGLCHGQQNSAGPIGRTDGLLGLRILSLLDAGVVVLRAISLRGTLTLVGWSIVILEVLVVNGEGFPNLLAESIVVLGTV